MASNIGSDVKIKYTNAKNRLVLLDYDGTLVNFSPQPEAATLPDHLYHILIKLVDDPKTDIFIITGRGYNDIDKLLSRIPIKRIAEHGAMIKENGIWKDQIVDDGSWKKAIMPILNQFTIKCPESFIQEKKFALAWHYRNVGPNIGYSRSRELIVLLEKVIHCYGLKILDGNHVVEILNEKIGKGMAVKKLVGQNQYDFILSVGDDATDEEMFKFFMNVPNAFSIKVGKEETFARYKLDSIDEVALLLKNLSE